MRIDPYLLIGAKRVIRRTIAALRMWRVDRRPLPVARDEIRLFVVVRNESLRLPFFFQHYRKLGVDRFFVVDNGSTDSTVDFMLGQERTHVFRTAQTFVRKEAWLDLMLRRYGVGHWCVVVDADEILLYPHSESADLRAFCSFMETASATALHCLLLDMYPLDPLSSVSYKPGEDPLKIATHFNPDSYRLQPYAFRNCRGSLNYRYADGVRRWAFGIMGLCCSKFPLFRFDRSMFLRDGAHEVEGSSIADLQGVLLHFKFLQDFAPRAAVEAVRGQHWDGAAEYKAYLRVLEQSGDVCLRFRKSVRFEGPDQLLRMELMRSSPELDAQVGRRTEGP